jgi:hypothetical protein
MLQSKKGFQMKTINDLVKESNEESLRLDLYFYAQELLKATTLVDKQAVAEKIRATEKLLNDLRY